MPNENLELEVAEEPKDPRQGRLQKKRPQSRSTLDVFLDLARDEYNSPELEANGRLVDTTQLGIFSALLRHRVYPEFIHMDQKHKRDGLRLQKSNNDRCRNTTSWRIHFPTLPQEWKFVRYCLPDAEEESPCQARIVGLSLQHREGLRSLGLRADDENTLFPDNENNPKLQKAIDCIIAKADLQLPCGLLTAREAYAQASKTGFSGIMEVDGIPDIPVVHQDKGIVYGIHDFVRKECRIGTTQNYKQRMAAYRTHRSGEICHLFIFKGGIFTEALIHRKLAPYRKSREFFELEPVLRWLGDMANMNAPLYNFLKS